MQGQKNNSLQTLSVSSHLITSKARFLFDHYLLALYHRLGILLLMRHVLSFEFEAGFLPFSLPHRYIAISEIFILMFLIITEPEFCDEQHSLSIKHKIQTFKVQTETKKFFWAL